NEHAGDGGEDSIYHRGVRSGKAPRKLVTKNDGDFPYELADYKEGGQVFYDSEHQILYIHFGPTPQTVIDFIYWQYSPHLAEFLESAPQIEPNTEVRVQLNGESRISIPPGFVRHDVTFPEEALNEVRQVARGFAAPQHVRDLLDNYEDWVENHPNASFSARERRKQEIIFSSNLDGKEILQLYRQTADPDSKVTGALTEIIHHLLNDSDYLSDKDPLKSLNDLVVNLGHKHEFISELGEALLPEDESLHPLYKTCFEIYNNELPVGFFPDKNPQHLSHNRILLKLTELFVELVDLGEDQVRLLRAAAVLHNLGMLEKDFASLLMNPNDRLDRPVFDRFLRNHPNLALTQFKTLLSENRISLPQSVDAEKLRKLLTHHHNYWTLEDLDSELRILQEILHVTDTLAVFSDRTRPDQWLRGYIELSELAPHWISAQSDAGRLSDSVVRATDRLFSDEYHDEITSIGQESRQFLVLFDALQLAGALEDGLNPQNPHMIRELQTRHNPEIINRIWTRVLESNLPVAEKVRIIRRLDELAPLFISENQQNYAFVNASPQPVQRSVNTIKQHLDNDRKVILIGFFPRVTESFERFFDIHGENYQNSIDDVVAIAGKRRLQFIRHSYPYEAEFEQPFHRIIENFRRTVEPATALCFIPFHHFFSGYSPTEDPASRVRQLEKASSVEEHSTPERVETESERYTLWLQNRDGSIDDHENERFRRILFNNFTNRDVLYFYRSTLRHAGGVQEALKETIGALRENPNYLSERNSRYNIHELIRSLSQIHFFSDQPPRAYALIRDYLDRLRVSNSKPYLELLDNLGTELNFYKNTLSTAVRVLDLIKGNESVSEPELFLTLAAGYIATSNPWRDYLLSPEDVSYNRTLRRRLLTMDVNISDEILSSRSFSQLDAETAEEVRDLLNNPETVTFCRVQAALHIAHGIDYSRVENWERGHRRIERRDLDHFLQPLEELFETLLSSSQCTTLNEELSSLKNQQNLETINSLAHATHSYVYLFNSLNLASELRYGLFPGGVNSLDNARELYGTSVVNKILDGLIESDLSVVDSIKFSRKIHYFASALQKYNGSPGQLYFLNLDRSGTWSLPENQHTSDDSFFVLSGELSNTLSFWEKLQSENPETAKQCFCLIGEEYPLLIKETSLSRTKHLRDNISTLRRDESLAGRYLFVPPDRILGGVTPQPSSVTGQYDCDPMSLYIRSWLSLFD
ncbi:MAG: hypothetical protein ABEK50_14410, partial [bacterium]